MRKPKEQRKPAKIDYRHGLAPELEPVKEYTRLNGFWYHDGISREVLAGLRGQHGR